MRPVRLGEIVQHRLSKEKIIVVKEPYSCDSDDFVGICLNIEKLSQRQIFSEHEIEKCDQPKKP